MLLLFLRRVRTNTDCRVNPSRTSRLLFRAFKHLTSIFFHTRNFIIQLNLQFTNIVTKKKIHE